MSLFRLIWQVPVSLIILSILLVSISGYAISFNSRRTKDVAYVSSTSPDFNPERHLLDIYTPRSTSIKGRPVVVFMHGGAWNSGSKNLYFIIGRRLAKQGVVAVVINYRLAPAVEVPAMADDCARAVLWTAKHIADYGGDPNRIFVMGHSAGGGLAALVATDDQLFTKFGLAKNPVKGAILDDPGGLDMFDYLSKMQYPGDDSYLVAFGKKLDVWHAVSPIYYLKADSPPVLMYAGENTYPGIASSTRRFNERLQELGIKHEFTVLPGKKHIPMVTQLFWKNNIIYRDLLKFVGAE